MNNFGYFTAVVWVIDGSIQHFKTTAHVTVVWAQSITGFWKVAKKWSMLFFTRSEQTNHWRRLSCFLLPGKAQPSTVFHTSITLLCHFKLYVSSRKKNHQHITDANVYMTLNFSQVRMECSKHPSYLVHRLKLRKSLSSGRPTNQSASLMRHEVNFGWHTAPPQCWEAH